MNIVLCMYKFDNLHMKLYQYVNNSLFGHCGNTSIPYGRKEETCVVFMENLSSHYDVFNKNNKIY